MEVEIIDVYKGKETRKTTVVWGDYGMLCRVSISQFESEQYYVIAFYKCSEGSKSLKDEKYGDYYISNCGDYWLKADNKKRLAIGSVTNKQTQIKLANLKLKILTK